MKRAEVLASLMLIHAAVSGHYDWAPLPPDVEPTEEDFKALRVKHMMNGEVHAKVEVARDTHTDVNIPELAICDRMASLVALGKPMSREAVVAEYLTETFRHHAPTKHLVHITVLDDGPDAEMYAADLARLGVTGERASEAMEAYADEPNVEAFVNVAFKTKSTRRARTSEAK